MRKSNSTLWLRIVNFKPTYLALKFAFGFGVLFNLGIIVSIFKETETYWSYFFYGALFLMTPLAILFLCYRTANRVRDKEVADLISGENDSSKPIILYLRPFLTDGNIPIGNEQILNVFKDFLIFNFGKAGGIEGRLIEVLSDQYMLLRFDYDKLDFIKAPIHYLRAAFSHRAGKIIDNSPGWEERVKRIAKKSHLCIVVPPVKEDSATEREIKTIIEDNFFEKTVFIMPSSDVKIGVPFSKHVKAHQIWQNLKRIVNDKIELPHYDKTGGFVIFSSGKYHLINSCRGSYWTSTKAIKSIFLDKKLVDPDIFDAAKIMFRLVWITPIIIVGVLGVLILSSTFREASNEAIYSAFAFAAFINFFTYYRYCKNFRLPKWWSLGLFLCTLSVMAIFCYICIEILNALRKTDGFYGALPEWAIKTGATAAGELSEVYILIEFLTMLLFASIPILMTAYFIFKKRRKESVLLAFASVGSTN